MMFTRAGLKLVQRNSATRAIASIFGIYRRLPGMERGCFEIYTY
jgi:hypothetical protein